MPISPTVYTYPIITSHTKHAWEYNVIYEWSLTLGVARVVYLCFRQWF